MSTNIIVDVRRMVPDCTAEAHGLTAAVWCGVVELRQPCHPSTVSPVQEIVSPTALKLNIDNTHTTLKHTF